MAKILCSISGIQFNCDHVPMSLQSREVAHPIFHLSQKKLYGLYAKWTQGSLTDTDSYLLYLALFNSTGLVEFRNPACQCEQTRAIVANNMTRLCHIVSKIDTSIHPRLLAAQFVVSAETQDFRNSHIWIEIWENNWQNFEDGYKKEAFILSIKKREEILTRLINSGTKNTDHFANILSRWAADAGEFPEFQISNPLTGQQCKLREYWMQIIQMCVRDDRIFTVPKADIEELIEHCDTYISAGNIYAFSLMNLLKTGIKKKEGFLEFGDIDAANARYRILSPDASVEDANKLAMIEAAPREKPVEKNYPSKIAYLRAKAKYDLAVSYYHDNPEQHPDYIPPASDDPEEKDVIINGVKL